MAGTNAQDPEIANRAEEEVDGKNAREDNPGDDDEIPVAERWGPVVDAVVKGTKEAFASGPAFDTANSSEFQSHWRTVFARIHDSVVADPAIAEKLTSPPTKKFTINLFDKTHAGGCPCCLPDVEPNITIVNQDGVSKGDFVRELASYLYGEELPSIYKEDLERDGPNVAGKRNHALVYSSNWMSSGKNAEGEKLVFGSWDDDGSVIPCIWLYCSSAENFKEKTTKEQ